MADEDRLAPLERRLPEPSAQRPSPTISVEPESSDAYFYLRAYWQIISRRRWTVLTLAVVLTTLVTIVSFKMKPVYRATARVQVEAETPPLQTLDDLYRTIPTDDSFLQTQVNVLRSDNLSWLTIQQLHLESDPQFNAQASEAAREPRESAAALQGRLLNVFKKHLRAEVVRDSRVLEVSFESTDAALAARVANALVSNYVEYNFRTRYDATRQASGWMEQQLEELKAKVEKSQQALVEYERQNSIVNVGEKQNVAEQRLADLSKDLTEAQSDRAQKEAIYELVRNNEDQVALVAENTLLQRLEEKYADLKSQHVEALNQYGPNFPKVIRIREQIEEIQSLINRERNRIVARIRNDYNAAVGREKLLSLSVAKQKAEVGRLNQSLIQHNILKREFETNQELYDNLLKRLKDATVSAGLRATNIHVVDQALIPATPVRPNKLLNIAIGLIVGLILAVPLAFVKEGLDNSIRTAEELECVAAMPVLAVVPLASTARSRAAWLGTRERQKANGTERLELAVLNQPSSAFTESYRALRTSILLSRASGPPQVLLVTSPQPREGKTCTSLNLASALAQRGGRVLIVNADLRKQSPARTLEHADGKGLSSYLTGAHKLEEVMHEFPPLSNLWVLPPGPQPPNPAELLSSPAMERMLNELRQDFAQIVLDSPPVLMVTDATILSSYVDGVILVVESGATPRGAVTRAHRILENAGAKILGVVLNKLDLERDGYYGSDYRYYRYYYSETSPKPAANSGVSGGSHHRQPPLSRSRADFGPHKR
jgi:capsular exopolysaccharide synthesis family protein